MARDPVARKRARDKYRERNRDQINSRERDRVRMNGATPRSAAALHRADEKRKQYKRNNRDKINADARARALSAGDEYRKKRAKAAKEYRDKNLQIARAKGALHMRRRRAWKRGADGAHTLDDIAHLYNLQSAKCATCRRPISNHGADKFHVDHVMPLARGGSDSADNLQLLCEKCNHRKHAKHPDQWAAENGLLFC